MTTRMLSGIALAVTGVLLLCSGLATTLIFGGGARRVRADYQRHAHRFVGRAQPCFGWDRSDR